MKAARKDPRHRAREAALQVLYHWEIGRTDVASAADTFFDLQWADAQAPPADLRTFATELAHDTVRRLPEADALIAETAERWRPERMAVLDRLILRMAVTELLRGQAPADAGIYDSTPPAVVINEALELARTFSTEEAVKFINGMLDAIRKKLAADG
ncbi:MAG TPA: transcription antitermination factor NusB [Vicinamibacterales bacterium]|nr:transcription antitermination factor NusB [Vicinamibacterales bacterium]